MCNFWMGQLAEDLPLNCSMNPDGIHTILNCGAIEQVNDRTLNAGIHYCDER